MDMKHVLWNIKNFFFRHGYFRTLHLVFFYKALKHISCNMTVPCILGTTGIFFNDFCEDINWLRAGGREMLAFMAFWRDRGYQLFIYCHTTMNRKDITVIWFIRTMHAALTTPKSIHEPMLTRDYRQLPQCENKQCRLAIIITVVMTGCLHDNYKGMDWHHIIWNSVQAGKYCLLFIT